jgi:hypothetical protein
MWVYVIEVSNRLTRERDIIRRIENTALTFGLRKTLEDKKSSQTHWHWKRGAHSGTLEATWDARAHEIRVVVHKNRVGLDGWAREAAPQFAEALAEQVHGTLKSIDATHRN